MEDSQINDLGFASLAGYDQHGSDSKLFKRVITIGSRAQYNWPELPNIEHDQNDDSGFAMEQFKYAVERLSKKLLRS